MGRGGGGCQIEDSPPSLCLKASRSSNTHAHASSLSPLPPAPAAGEQAAILNGAPTLAQLAGVSLGAALEAEQAAAVALGGEMGAVSALRVLHLYLERLGCDLAVRRLLPPLAIPP